jgi:nitrogen fixation NifU-like protein
MTQNNDEYKRQEAEINELYREIILDHYRSPRKKGSLASPTVRREGYNPLCGDEITVDLRVDGSVVRDVAFKGSGCSISQASASMMAEAIEGKTVEEVESLFSDFTKMMRGTDEIDPERLGDLEAMMGVRKFPVRVKCATLVWHTLKEALRAIGASQSGA